MIKKYKIQSLLFIIFGLLYFYILFNLYSTMTINSDFSSFILESEEIKNGNIFLKDWNFTGIIFLFTDLLYFLIGSLFFGVSVNSYILGITLMYFVYLIITIKFILGKDKNINFKKILLLFALCLFPNQFALDILRTHLPIYTLFLISLFNYEKYLLSNKKRYLKILFITFVISSISDAIIIIIGLIPILIIYIYKYIYSIYKKKDLTKLKSYKILALYTTISVILGIILERLYILIGNGNRNHSFEGRSFISLNELGDKLKLYFNSILEMSKSQIFGKQFASVDTIISCIYLIFILLAYFIIFINIKKFIFNEEKADIISQIISIGIVIISLVFIFTSIAFDFGGARYICGLPVLFAILIIRFFDFYDIWKFPIKVFSYGFIFLCIIMIGYSSYKTYYSIKSNSDINNNLEQLEIIELLEDKNLKNGYGDFWNSAITSVLSQGDITVRQINMTSDNISIYKWFCGNKWFKEYANFIVIRKNGDSGFGVNKENCLNVLGQPKEILEGESYYVYIYDYDISRKLS